MTSLTILYEDENYIVVNKPADMLVHRTSISEDTAFLLQQLRRQVKHRVYPVHRLDRATSGAMIWAKSSTATSRLALLFKNHEVKKTYLAIVRGWTDNAGLVDYPLSSMEAPQAAPQPARTAYQTWVRSEMPWAIGNRHATARFSLVTAMPQTGRWHQIRRHFSHLRHPIIGDKRHGDNKHNKFFREELGINRLLLHAWQLSFVHPFLNEELLIEAPLDAAFRQAIQQLALVPAEGNLLGDRAQPGPAENDF